MFVFLRNITTRWCTMAIFIVVLFCIRYIPLESRAGPSDIKTGVSFLCLLFLILRTRYISKALVFSAMYYVVVLSLCLFHPITFRWSTMLYLLSFIIVYITYYNLVVVHHVIDYKVFVKVLIGLIYAYTFCLIVQQGLILIGVREFPLLNLTQFLNRGIGANSLSGEPSSSARIMAVLYLALIRMAEIKYNRKIKVKEMWYVYKLPTIAFLWSMFTMGSATAMIGIVLLSLYFIDMRHLSVAIVIFCTFMVAAPHIDYKPVQRVHAVVTAIFTGDKETVFKADDSAASRVIPIINFFALDFADSTTWFGKGIDYSDKISSKHHERVYARVLGNINEYGLISYIFLLLLVYSCMIYRLFSLETLFLVFLFSGTLGNVPYGWGAMMIFTTIRYFQEDNYWVN